MSIPKFSFTARAAPFIEVGVGDTRTDVGVARWDVAHWGDPTDATWSGSEPLWTDETCHGYSIEVMSGRQRNTDLFAPATATITLDNSDGWADATLLTLRPGRSVRVGIRHAVSGRHILFRGIVDGVIQDYTPDAGDSVEISAVCAMGEVGRVQLADLADPGVGNGETADDRVNRILAAAKWPISKRDLEVTSVACLPTRLGQQVADLFGQVCDSTGGAIYGDTDGAVVFRGRDWQMFLPEDPVDATIGNVLVSDVCPSEWHLSHRRDDLVTQVILGRDGVDDVPFTFDDAAGQELYGVESFRVTDLICSAMSQLTTLAARQFRVRGGANSHQRVERVLIDAATADDALDLATTVTAFDPPSRLHCRLTLDRGEVFSTNMIVTGVRHQMTPDEWTCELDLDTAAPFQTAAARWSDNAGWGYTTWAAPGLLGREGLN